MRKKVIWSAFLFFGFFPILLKAIPESEIKDRMEMSQVWVDQHNAKLPTEIQNAVKGIRVKPHVYFIGSRHVHVVPLKRAPRGTAFKNGIPASVETSSGAIVPLVSLRYSAVGGQSFLTADYADELDIRHSSSDIYIKIGLEYRHLFHGEGYPGCARVVDLGKDMPIFFEVGIYGGGSRCEKTFYRLDTDALKGVPDELYDHPELIQADKYVKEELKVNVWLEGYTLYRDVNHDGTFDIINTTDVLYPPDLKTKVEERYNLVDTDFTGPFRRVTSVYKWDTTKGKFLDLGDYYH
jgi:hypothetical protein